MKKVLFKGLLVLGAMLGFANMLSVQQVHADDTIKVNSVRKISMAGYVEGEDNPGIMANANKFDLSFDPATNTINITDNGLTSYVNGSTLDRKRVGLLVDLGVKAEGVEYNGVEYTIDDADYTQATRWGATNDTTFVMWLREDRNGQDLVFKNVNEATDTVTIHIDFNTIKVNSVRKISMAGYVDGEDNIGIARNANAFDLKFNSSTNAITITDNGLTSYVNGSTLDRKRVGLLVDLGVKAQGVEYNGVEYTIDDADYTQAERWGAENDTTFVMWLREDRNGETLRFKNVADANDYVDITIAYVKGGSSSSSHGNSGGSSSSTTGNTNTGTVNTGDTNTGTVETGTVDTGTENEETVSPVDPQAVQENGFTKEFNDAYEFAFANGITTMKSIKEAAMDEGLTRIAMAKMLSQYAINVLKKTPDTSKECKFNDVSAELDAEYDNGVTLACQLGIMGVGIEDFRPFDTVVRAEFGTALSRLLFGIEDGVEAYYTTHLAKLKEAGIISNDDPTLEELRGYVMLMLMRSAK